MLKKMIQAFCLGLIVSLFPTQTFAQEITPEIKIQDQNNEEEEDEKEIEEVAEPEQELEMEEKADPEEETEVEVEPETEVKPEEEAKPEPEMEPETEPETTTQPIVQQPQQTIQSSIEVPSYIPVYEDKGYEGSLDGAILEDNFITKNYDRFLNSENPFVLGQCTWFTWSRFYQVYGFDCQARGNGKQNALEIVEAYGDNFELSSTPAAGSVFSMEKNTLYPEYGHSGFVEAFDGEYIWISEGNVKFGQNEGNIWIHKVKWTDFKQQFPDVVFAVPKVDDVVKERFMNVHKTFFFCSEVKRLQ